MFYWKKLRILILFMTAFGIFFVLFKSLGSPRFLKPKVGNIAFPETVSLRGWQQEVSFPVESPLSNSTQKIFGRHYRYIQNNLSLDVEIRYLYHSNGDVQRLVKEFTHLDTRQLSAEMRQRKDIGFYGVFIHEQKANLSACINPQGYSTFNARQFLQNQITPDVLLKRFLPWLIEEKNLRDRRCLWVKLSVPLKDSSTDNTYLSLEQAWFDWYRWWRPRFPNS
jgi:cyanosortase A-associated protein